jgi:hypothetical protein
VAYRLHEAHQFTLCGLPTSLIVTLKMRPCTTTNDFYFISKELKILLSWAIMVHRYLLSLTAEYNISAKR